MKTLLLAAVIGLLSTTAFADPGNQGQGQGGCGVGQQTNGCGAQTTSVQQNPAATAVGVGVGIGTGGDSVAGAVVSGVAGGSASVSGVAGGSASVSGVAGGAASVSGVKAETGPITSKASNDGVKQEVAFSNPRQVASAFAPSVVNVAPCTAGSALAVQGERFGISFGGSKQSVSCERRANAALLDALGEREAAVLLLSNDPEVNKAVTAARSR